jgi:subtilisin family serine protease
VISQSFHRSSEARSGDLQSDDVYKDWLAVRWPYPTVVQAAGNYFVGDDDGIGPPASEYVNHKTFNGLVVGNHDDTATAMSGDSVFRNPTSPRHDRELPEISANGTEVTTVGLTMSGTSMAAPAVAGCVALLQEADPVLQSWPEACRAIVLAGAQRLPDNRTWFGDLQDGVDAVQGAGAIDVRSSLDIVRARQLPNNAAARCGWDAGTLDGTNVGSDGITTFRYTVIAPGLMYQPYLKVALAWDSNVRTSNVDRPLTAFQDVDLDLLVHDQTGAVVAQSASYDNTYEIAELRCRPGRTFTITIHRYDGDRPVYYSVAWIVSSRPVFVRPVDGVRPGG